MKNKFKYSLLGLIVLLLVIQLIPVNRNNPPINKSLEINVPIEIKEILVNSCFDCHSNQTKWPFYSYIAPISWLVAHDVHEGREEFNFSLWLQLPIEKRERLKEKMLEEIYEDEMPLPIYLITHSDAKLSNQQKQEIKKWTESNSDEE